jgi:adenylate cyclase class 1
LTQYYSPILLNAEEEEVSNNDLQTIVLRFKYFNQCRLKRLQEFLQVRQYEFLQLLPLIFHINHPSLPGFVSLNTPAGFATYEPDKAILVLAKYFAKGFEFKHKSINAPQMHSLFLMGSVGSVAFSRHSDIDIWLCHAPNLSQEALNLLQSKAQEVEKYAATLKIEMHFFLLDAEQFKRGENAPLSMESSGQTQHYLLLEEFYRTAIYLVGRMPLWWIVPPSQEVRYADFVDFLLDKRLIDADEYVDFGGLQTMPLAEFVSATLWQIYKSLSAPHKSLLKLLLMESYASQFPTPQWLSTVLKLSIYQGDYSVDSLDPYLLIYSRVDSYLQALNAAQRLSLARECFQLKIMGANDAELDQKTRVLRENYLQNVAREWHWLPAEQEKLNSRKNWTIEKACSEHLLIRDQLQQCLRMILKLVGNPVNYNYQDNTDFKLISRKLRVALDVLPEKVEVLTTRTMVQEIPTVLLLVEYPQKQGHSVWRLYREAKPNQASYPEVHITQAATITELLCWMVLNGMYEKHVNLKLVSVNLKVANNDLKALIGEINEFLTTHLASIDNSLQTYAQANRTLSSLLIVNLAENFALDEKGQMVISERSNPFSYGENRVSFVQSIVKVTVSSWGEVNIHNYLGFSEFLDSLLEVFNKSALPFSAARIKVICYTPARAKSIVARIKQLFEQLQSYFMLAGFPSKQRYILAGEGAYYVFYCRDQVLRYQKLDNNQQLLQELGSVQAEFSPPGFDGWVLEQTVIPALYKQNQAGIVQLFYFVSAKYITVYVIDEKGALFIAQHSNVFPQQILKQYGLFLGALLLQAKLSACAGIKCFEIQKKSSGEYQFQAVQFKLDDSALSMRVGIRYAQASAEYVIYCNERSFAFEDANSFKAVKQQILSYRKSCDDFPIYLTDVDVPCRILGAEDAEQLQAVHFLRYKQKIEERLNLNS